MDYSIKEFSIKFSQFEELLETFKFFMYPDVISFDELNLSKSDWYEIEKLEIQLIQKSIETREGMELIETERLTSNISLKYQ